MSDPVSGTAAALAWLEAASAVIGTGTAVSQAASSGDSGFHVGPCEVKYPTELPTDMWAGEYQHVDRVILKFTADGYFWNNDLEVTMSGYASDSNEPLMCRTDSSNPNIPANRFLHYRLGIAGSSEDMGEGLLTVEFDTWDGVAEGSADHPKISIRASGRFDPVGFGDTRYELRFTVDTYGQVDLQSSSSNQCQISDQGDHILIHLNQ